MNPDLQYTKMAPGKNNGSSTGVLDAHNIPDIIDANGLIQHSPLWTKQDQLGVKLWSKSSVIYNVVIPYSKSCVQVF